MSTQKVAILTADIVASTQIDAHIKSNVLSIIDTYLKNHSEINTYEIFRGDSFQCLISNVNKSLKIALEIKNFIKSINLSQLNAQAKTTKITKTFHVKSDQTDLAMVAEPISIYYKKAQQAESINNFIDIRISLGVGEVAYIDTRLATSDGEAFILSGRGLDAIKETKQTFFVTSNDAHKRELETESMLLDYILSSSTVSQSEVLCMKLKQINETEIAKELGINQSAVNQRSKAAGWHVITKTIKRFEEIYG